MTGESLFPGSDIEQQEPDRVVKVRVPRDDVFLNRLHLSAMYYSIIFAVQSDYPVIQPIDFSDAEALVSCLLKFEVGVTEIGRKKTLEMGITGREMTAYGKSIPRMESALNYIAAIGGPSRLTLNADDTMRSHALGTFRRLNDAFVAAGGTNNLRLLHTLEMWVGGES